MTYYKDTNNRFHCLEEGITPEMVQGFPRDAVQITEAEYIAATTPVLTIAEKIDQYKQAVDVIRANKLTAGISYPFPDNPVEFETGKIIPSVIQTRDNNRDIKNITAYYLACFSLKGRPALLDFWDEKNVTHRLTPEQGVELGCYVFSRHSAIEAAAFAKKREIEALKTQKAIDNYDVTAGWPEE